MSRKNFWHWKGEIKMYAVGADIGGTAVKIGILNEDGKIIAKSQIPTRQDNKCGFVLKDTADEIKRLMEENKIEPENTAGIGIGIPGPVADGIVKHCVNLYWEDSVDAAAIMEKLTGIRSVVLNDANAAALGEQWMGGGKGHSSMVLVTIGTGIGGGIVIDGNVLTGSGGAGGEIGHIVVDYDSKRKCNCGRYGCLETYASATGIVRTAVELLEKDSGPSVLRNTEVTAKAVFDAAENNDETALKTVDIFGRYLGRALANIAAVVDPEVIVLAGGVVKGGEKVRRPVDKYYRESAFKSVKGTKIVLAELENDAGIFGAAREAFKTRKEKII